MPQYNDRAMCSEPAIGAVSEETLNSITDAIHEEILTIEATTCIIDTKMFSGKSNTENGNMPNFEEMSLANKLGYLQSILNGIRIDLSEISKKI